VTAVAIGRRALDPKPVAWLGVALAILGLLSTLPPVTIRTPVPALVLCLLAVGCGAIALGGGVTQEGWWAICGAVICGWLAWEATQASSDTLEAVVNAGLFAAMLRYATPLTFAALGGLFSERSGVVNIGLEGGLLTGAFFGFWAAAGSGSWIIGVGSAALFGAALGLIHAIFCISLRADQIVVGTGINILALGVTTYIFRALYGLGGTPPNVDRIPNLSIPGVRDIPFVGDIIGDLNLMVWLSIAAVILSWLVLWRTPVGLRIRAVGENPQAAEGVGINVYLVRYCCVIVGGAIAALGGAFLSFGFLDAFNENMTLGRGFIGLAVLILGKWRPFPILFAAMLFGLSSAVADRLADTGLSSDLLQTIPYVVTMVALVGFIGRATPPAADGLPYIRGGR
jgi:general nucleoside transport system permease protein